MCLDTAEPRWNLGSAVEAAEAGKLNKSGTTWPRPLLSQGAAIQGSTWHQRKW